MICSLSFSLSLLSVRISHNEITSASFLSSVCRPLFAPMRGGREGNTTRRQKLFGLHTNGSTRRAQADENAFVERASFVWLYGSLFPGFLKMPFFIFFWLLKGPGREGAGIFNLASFIRRTIPSIVLNRTAKAYNKNQFCDSKALKFFHVQAKIANLLSVRFSISIWARLVPSSVTVPGSCELLTAFSFFRP